jgi:hypothetical protein
LSKGTELVIEAFGGVLQQQGAGFYVTLELFALVWGSIELGNGPLPDPSSEALRFRRRTHDYARRLMADPERLSEDELQHVCIGESASTLRALLTALTVQTPGRRSRDNWRTSHFLPYVGDLVHYEGVFRGEGSDPTVWRANPDRAPSIEQNLYRGGGSLAHRILREDPDRNRLEATRHGLLELLRSSDGALGRVARALQEKDRAQPDEAKAGNEERARVLETRWVENLRSGVNLIVGNESIARSRKVDALLYWIPFCIALHQLDRAYQVLFDGEDYPGLVVFCAAEKSPVKAISTDHAKGSVYSIYRSLTHLAQTLERPDYLETASWRTSPRGFFSTTLGNVGFFNARTGQRHFTFGPELLEAIVIATVESEMEFEQFCRGVLSDRFGLIVDSNSAERRGLLRAADRSAFDRNAEGLLAAINDLGMVREFSDATRMIRARFT